MIPEMFMMMDSTDFEEHLLLNALEDDPVDEQQHGDCDMGLVKHHRPLSTKTLSSVSAATAETAMMDEEDIDNFFFDDGDALHDNDQGVEMVINEDNEDSKISALVQGEVSPPAHKKRPSTLKKPKKVVSKTSFSSKKNFGDGPVQVGMPEKFDVLCGQSRICASHTGNRRFQVVLDIYAPTYDAATSKQEKMTMTKEIVASIQLAGGRFLKYKEGQWEEISDVTARDKTSHALRTKVASWKRQQQEKKKGETTRRSSTAPSRASHRRGGLQRGRRSSGSSVNSDIVATSFDGNDSASANVMSELIKAQKQIFATMTTGEPHPLKTAT